MKKIFSFLTILVLLGLVSACDNTTPDPDPDPDPTPYDERGLVPESCTYLDNIDDWQPVWCEEFDEDGLPNPDKFSYDVGGTGWGNNELQYYTDARLENAFVEDGLLTIRAIKEDYMGSDYTSARLVTKYKGDWQYGRIQVRAKMPEGRGTWSALWMLPTDWVYGGWPFSGEIDIMEHVGYDPDTIHGTIHTGAYNHGLNTQIGYSKTLPSADSAFHVYEMIWEPGKIELFVDGERFAVFGYNADLNTFIENSDAWPFDERFHLILNVAIGGNWGGVMGVDDSAFPTEMQVDYVRVFQKDYAGLDEEAPSQVERLLAAYETHNKIKIKWDHADDDVYVKQYNIYIEDELIGDTSLNAFLIEDLDPATTYQIAVEAEDFAGNKSEKRFINLTTNDVREIPAKIEAEDYDAMDGVQLEDTSDTGGGQNVGWIDTGDYLEYILNVTEAGEYVINYRVASEENSGEITLMGRTRFPLAVTSFEATGDWQNWTTVTSEPFELDEGIITFRLDITQGGFNLNYIEFIKVG